MKHRMQQRTRAYNVWSEEEKQALQNGVTKHGLGAWEIIRKDPEFACLEKRTGVQLKDKFRNLVKFRHLSEDESRQLKPKTNGPWSRKYSNSGGQQFERSQTRSPSRQPSPAALLSPQIPVSDEKEHAEALLALEKNRYGDDEDIHSEGEAVKHPRKRRRSCENRSFGIYDTRRYKADGSQWTEGEGLQGTYTRSVPAQRGRPPQRRRGRGGGKSSWSRYDEDTYDEDSEETVEDEEELEALRNGERRRSQRTGSRRAAELGTGSMVSCLCGAQEDDGAEMIECEDCKYWAHTHCLQTIMVQQPGLHHYDLDQYKCYGCQNLAQQRANNSFIPGGLGSNFFNQPHLPLSLSPFGLPMGGNGGLPMFPGMLSGSAGLPGGLGALLDSVPLQHGSSGGLGALLGLPLVSGNEDYGGQLPALAQQQELLKISGFGAGQQSQYRSLFGDGGLDAEAMTAAAAVAASMNGVAGKDAAGGSVAGSNEAIAQLLGLTSKDGASLKDSAAGKRGTMEERGPALQGLQGHPGGMAGLVRSGSNMGMTGNNTASDDMDSLTNFLAGARTGSALRHRSSSPARASGVNNQAAVNTSVAAHRARAERGSLGGSVQGAPADGGNQGGSSKGGAGDASMLQPAAASHHGLDQLLAVAHAVGGGVHGGDESQPPQGSDANGGAADALIDGGTKIEPRTEQQPASSAPPVLHYPLAQHAGSAFRPPSRGPPPSLLYSTSTSSSEQQQQQQQQQQSSNDTDHHEQQHHHQQQLALLGLLGGHGGPSSQAHAPPVFPHPAYPHRAPTPSQAFIDSLLRGTTPDIAIAPLMHGATGTGHAGGPGLPYLSSIHQELALLAHSNSHSSLGDVLRPGTPDAWSFLHGATTPTPDFHVLQNALATDFGAGHANWLLNRGTPPLPPVADLQVPQQQQQPSNRPLAVAASALIPDAALVVASVAQQGCQASASDGSRQQHGEAASAAGPQALQSEQPATACNGAHAQQDELPARGATHNLLHGCTDRYAGGDGAVQHTQQGDGTGTDGVANPHCQQRDCNGTDPHTQQGTKPAAADNCAGTPIEQSKQHMPAEAEFKLKPGPPAL